MINTELLQLKDEFLKELREIENKLEQKIERNSKIFEIKNQEQEDKINLTSQKNDQIYNSMIEQKVKIEKISELSISQKKLNDMLISHEMRINSLLTENKKMAKNYHKIITDNLTVPGFIGASCTYKNLSEYIQINIKEMTKLKIEREKDRRMTEDFRNKLDNIMKNTLILVDNSVTRCKQYTDNKQVYLENILNNKLVEFNEKNMDLRTQFFTSFSKFNIEVEKMELKLDELNKLKEEVNNEINIKLDEIKNSFEENKIYIDKNIEEIKTYKNTISDIIDEKLDNFKTNQKNAILTPNLKTLKRINKREETMSIFKNAKNINNINKVNEVRSRQFKRYTMVNSKTKPKNLMLDIKEKEKTKISLNFEYSDEDSSSKNDENNIILKNSISKEENNKKEKNEQEKKEKENNEKENKKEENKEELKEEIKNENKEINELKNEKVNEENKFKKEEKIYINKRNTNKNNKYNINKSIINKSNSNSKEKIPVNIENKNPYINNLDKTLNSYYIRNIKTTVNKTNKSPEINNNKENETITVKENKIKIPKIVSNSKDKEKIKLNNEFKSNKNLFKKLILDEHNNYKTKLETKNNKSKSTNNTYNYIKLSKEKVKEKFFATINNDTPKKEKKIFYNTSPKFYNSIETQTPKSKLFFKNKKGKFPKIGFSYKIINLGTNINFKERRLENFQKKDENPKLSIDLSIPLTNTYKAYQKKKNDKKNNKKSSLNELPLKEENTKHKYFFPVFKNSLINEHSIYKKKFQSIDYEYINLKRKKNKENEHSIESVKSTKNKIITEKIYK